MPLLKLQVSREVDAARAVSLLPELSKIVARTLGKPENYVMVVVEQAPILMAGQAGPAAFADVRGIGGINAVVNEEFSRALCELAGRELGIAANRIYVTFADVSPENWGWNKATFA